MPKAVGTVRIAEVECMAGGRGFEKKVAEVAAIAIEKVLRMHEQGQYRFLQRSGFWIGGRSVGCQAERRQRKGLGGRRRR